MNMAQARREARSLAAEWIETYRRTDTSWREPYTAAGRARVDAALDGLYDQLNEAGPSLFFRLTPEQRAAGAAELPERESH